MYVVAWLGYELMFTFGVFYFVQHQDWVYQVDFDTSDVFLFTFHLLLSLVCCISMFSYSCFFKYLLLYGVGSWFFWS